MKESDIHGAIIPTEKDIERALLQMGWKNLIKSVKFTFEEEAHGKAISPPKMIMDINSNSDYRVMPSYLESFPIYCGTKIISANADNPIKHGLPLASGLYILNETERQRAVMICDATLLTAYRTAAASAVAVHALVPYDTINLGFIGCGQQLYYHIPAISAVRNVENILVKDISRAAEEKAFEFDKRVIMAESKKDVFDICNVVVTLTPTYEPHIGAGHFPKNKDLVICAVGGDSERKIEFYPQILRTVDHYCDSYEQALHTGLISQAIEKRIIRKKDLKSLGDYLTHKKGSGIIGPDGHRIIKKIKMFISTGVALEDLITAIKIYEFLINEKPYIRQKAVERGELSCSVCRKED